MKNKTLILVVADYPYGPEESFLEIELKYIALKFNKVYFLLTNPDIGDKKIMFYIPDNSEMILMNDRLSYFDKIKFVKYIFNKSIWEEINIIRKHYKIHLSISVIRVVFYAFLKANKFLKNLNLLLKEKNIDIDSSLFYSYWNTEYSFAIAKFKTLNPQVKAFTRTHGWDIYFERHNPPYLPFRSYMLKNLDKVFTISDNGKKYLIEKNKHLKLDNINVSRLGTPPGSFDETYIKSNPIKVLSIAYISKLKRINLIIDALAELDSISVEWTHIGGGKIFEEIKKYAQKKLANKANVVYELKGNTSKPNVYKILNENRYDFLINTSYTEGIPVSMMEALSFGIPIIGTNVGGVGELIDDNVNGILLPPNPSPVEVADKISKIYKMTDVDYTSMRWAAYNTWSEKYNAEMNFNMFVDELISLYND